MLMDFTQRIELGVGLDSSDFVDSMQTGRKVDADRLHGLSAAAHRDVGRCDRDAET
jgi:hypothetical protein